MHFQMAITALLLTSLFAIPAQAIEDDEKKKKRAIAKTTQQTTVTSDQQSVAQNEDDRDCESIPASFYKKLDMSSF